jgi:shikimate dehydrogenase
MRSVRIDSDTSLYAVFGNPVAHSLSPAMHNAALAHREFNAVYLAFRITDVHAAVTAVRELNMGGASVTIPHKIDIMPLLDDIEPLAAAIGAVNTILNRDGRLIGANTDCTGAMAALNAVTPVSGKRVGIIGAGGAARAVAFGAAREQAEVCIINRTTATGAKLARELNTEFRPLAGAACDDLDILINTTPVGMTPRVSETPIPADRLSPETLVMDAVYAPPDTAFLKAAARQGCRTIDGIDMFVAQGADQFSLWTGLSAPVELMRSTVESALAGRHAHRQGGAS